MPKDQKDNEPRILLPCDSFTTQKIKKDVYFFNKQKVYLSF
jgi:hypothetical protein